MQAAFLALQLQLHSIKHLKNVSTSLVFLQHHILQVLFFILYK